MDKSLSLIIKIRSCFLEAVGYLPLEIAGYFKTAVLSVKQDKSNIYGTKAFFLFLIIKIRSRFLEAVGYLPPEIA
jgi:hypothetical protein